ncbi:1-phosphatidylinositol-4,5-bisphosphate phosphodiesterase [Thozetella sp. PMI_491]|nr:1-phosphatidylinositol-4,5-bisphosphate phosphodiesterase [Thozetella sp. PMI_491]
MTELASQLAGLNPFSKKKKGRGDFDEEDIGEHFGADLIDKQGGFGAHPPIPRVSHALQSFLAEQGVLSEHSIAKHEQDAPSEALCAILEKPVAKVPSALLDRSHPLPEYFISSSHNTYLLAHQLFGTSNVSGYETALRTGSRCVEIDAWDNDDSPDEPKVTHGYTLVSHIPFRDVCQTISNFWDEEEAKTPVDGHAASPIFLSLENHCSPHGQLRLVEIIKEVFGHRLLSEAVRSKGHREQSGSGEHVLLEELGGKIVLIVEYHIPGEVEVEPVESSSEDSEDEDEERAARLAYKGKKKQTEQAVIIPELAALGVYAQSVKPSDNSWFDSPEGLKNGPHHHLINVSESGLNKHLKDHGVEVAKHNAEHLMRVFPKGLRISSSNLRPVTYWGVGAQICALNWQTFGRGNQLNEALFSGSDGYVLKPAELRAGGDGLASIGRKKRLRLYVGGATDVPLAKDEKGETHDPEDLRPYLTCTLYHPSDLADRPPKRKTSAYKHHGENPAATDPVWDEVLEWEYDESQLVFLRMMVKADVSWARNPVLAVAAVRLSYVQTGSWRFVRMRDLHGVKTGCTVLVKFELDDI